MPFKSAEKRKQYQREYNRTRSKPTPEALRRYNKTYYDKKSKDPVWLNKERLRRLKFTYGKFYKCVDELNKLKRYLRKELENEFYK